MAVHHLLVLVFRKHKAASTNEEEADDHSLGIKNTSLRFFSYI